MTRSGTLKPVLMNAVRGMGPSDAMRLRSVC
jgi:hypothetical protein